MIVVTSASLAANLVLPAGLLSTVSLSAVFVGLCVNLFIFKSSNILKDNFVLVGKASSFAIFCL
jgi:hypothetical protein